MHVIKYALITFINLVIFSKTAFAERWVVTTLEWPPFACSRCPDNGAAAKALKETLKTVGVKVEFVFYPWVQAIKKGEHPNVVGFFPAWLEEIPSVFTPSEPLFRSPLGFIQQRDKPLVWSKLTDLKGKKIGVTEGYGNTMDFNRLVREKILTVESVKNDSTNVRKVALGQLDAALMDVNNARYLIHVTQPHLAGRVTVNTRILEEKNLYFAFNIHNKERSKKLKEGLKNVNFQRLVDDYLLKYLRRSD